MSNSDPVLELYKVEYDKGATRYENIYQAMWRIFSHVVVVSGAILSFGSDRLTPELLGFLVGLPLVFWFLSTYIPLDRYGNSTLERLRTIEATLNRLYGTQLDQFGQFINLRKGLVAFVRRTQFFVWLFFVPLTVFTAVSARDVFCKWLRNEPLLVQQQPREFAIKLDSNQWTEFLKISATGTKETTSKPVQGRKAK